MAISALEVAFSIVTTNVDTGKIRVYRYTDFFNISLVQIKEM